MEVLCVYGSIAASFRLAWIRNLIMIQCKLSMPPQLLLLGSLSRVLRQRPQLCEHDATSYEMG